MVEVAEDTWSETWGFDLPDGTEEFVREQIEMAHRCVEREDWTGAWLAAGTARQRLRAVDEGVSA
jgi:hypothetical protein